MPVYSKERPQNIHQPDICGAAPECPEHRCNPDQFSAVVRRCNQCWPNGKGSV